MPTKAERFSNLGESTVDTSYTAGDPTIDVVDASTFPADGIFRIRLDNPSETILIVNSVSGDTFTVDVEANDGNASAGVAVVQVGTKGEQERLLQGPNDDEARVPWGVDGGDYVGPLYKLVALDQSGWSWVNQGSASVAQANGIVLLTIPNAAGENIRMRVKTAPSTPYMAAVAFIPNPLFVGTATEAGFGICFRESGTAKIASFGIRGSGGSVKTTLRKNTDPTTFSSNALDNIITPVTPWFFRIGNDGTNLTYEIGFDGLNWTTLQTELKTAFFTTAPDQIGIVSMLNTTGLENRVSYLSWLET